MVFSEEIAGGQIAIVGGGGVELGAARIQVHPKRAGRRPFKICPIEVFELVRPRGPLLRGQEEQMLGQNFTAPARACDSGNGAKSAERTAGARVKDMAQFPSVDLELPLGSAGSGKRPSWLEQEIYGAFGRVARVDHADRPFAKRKPGFVAVILRGCRWKDFRRAE